MFPLLGIKVPGALMLRAPPETSNNFETLSFYRCYQTKGKSSRVYRVRVVFKANNASNASPLVLYALLLKSIGCFFLSLLDG